MYSEYQQGAKSAANNFCIKWCVLNLLKCRKGLRIVLFWWYTVCNGKVVWTDIPSARHSQTEDKIILYEEYLIDYICKCIWSKVYTINCAQPMPIGMPTLAWFSEVLN